VRHTRVQAARIFADKVRGKWRVNFSKSFMLLAHKSILLQYFRRRGRSLGTMKVFGLPFALYCKDLSCQNGMCGRRRRPRDHTYRGIFVYNICLISISNSVSDEATNKLYLTCFFFHAKPYANKQKCRPRRQQRSPYTRPTVCNNNNLNNNFILVSCLLALSH